MTPADDKPPFSHVLTPADLPTGAPTGFDLRPDPAACRAIAGALGLDGLRKLRFHGQLAPLDRRDWRLDAQLGATVVQPCVVSLAPVTTRIEEPVTRVWRADPAPVAETDEVEMPEDVSEEPLGAAIDLGQVMVEALALALPPYPRAPGVTLAQAQFTEAGRTPMRDEDARPFAGLAALRGRLGGGGTDDDGSDQGGGSE